MKQAEEVATAVNQLNIALERELTLKADSAEAEKAILAVCNKLKASLDYDVFHFSKLRAYLKGARKQTTIPTLEGIPLDLGKNLANTLVFMGVRKVSN